MRVNIENTINKLYDFNTRLTNDDRSNIAEQLEQIKRALLDSKTFTEYIELLGRPECEIYKSELHGSAILNLERLEKVLD